MFLSKYWRPGLILLFAVAVATLGACGRDKASTASSPNTLAPPSIRIGNFFYNAPNGIAFIKDDGAAFVIDPGGLYDAGTAAPDDSFHESYFSPQKAANPWGLKVHLVWSRRGDAIIASIDSEGPGDMTFNLAKNWPGFASRYSADGPGLKGEATLPSGKNVTWRLATLPALKSVDKDRFTVPMEGPGRPTYLVAGFGELPPSMGRGRNWPSPAQPMRPDAPRPWGPQGIYWAPSPTI
jgi:hypothetical protein